MAGYWHPEIERMFTEQKARDRQILALLEQQAARDERILHKLDKIYDLLARTPASMLLTITLEGDQEMPLTVDSVNAVAVLSFEDDHGDAVAPPAGALATATSDNTAVLTVGAAVAGADANGVANIQFPLAEVAEGTANLSVAATDANGNPLLGPDGVTPIPAPAPVAVTVNPGAAAAEVLPVKTLLVMVMTVGEARPVALTPSPLLLLMTLLVRLNEGA